mgnify:CR=1 FL=1
MLLDQVPWNKLSKEVFTKTYFVDTPEETTESRLLARMTQKVGLTVEEAKERIQANDLVNARFIVENTNLENHNIVKIEHNKNIDVLLEEL